MEHSAVCGDEMTYNEAIEYIHGVYWRGSKLGLERITELLSLLGNPQDRLRFVHVAGTNGKGTVCAMLSSVLAAAGYKTGLYISPYIERFNERIQMNNIPILDAALCEVTEYVRGFAETMVDLPTEFEIVCAIAFEYFLREGCEIVVLEVGLGGRLDATNVIKTPLAAVITSISYDHMQYLGGTLREIAAEKCGIIKENAAVVSYEQIPEAAEIVARKCGEMNASLSCCDFSKIELLANTLDRQRLNYKDYAGIEIKLLGEYQTKNAALALETITALGGQGIEISGNAVKTGMANAAWPARFEVLCRDPVVILDGAHNADGARAAAEAAAYYLAGREIVVVLGMLRDKDCGAMLSEFDKIAARYIATCPDNPRALEVPELARELGRFGKQVLEVPDAGEAINLALEIARTDNMAVVAAGSLYMAGKIRSKLLTPEQEK